MPERFSGPLLESARCDQEAYHDANLIRQAQSRLQRAEKHAAEERALKLVALLFIPTAFMGGILLAACIMRVAGQLESGSYQAFAGGCLVSIVMSLGAISGRIGAAMLEKVESVIRRSLW